MPCSCVLRITDARAVHSPRDFDLQDGGGFWWLAVWRLGLAMGNRGVEGWEGWRGGTVPQRPKGGTGHEGNRHAPAESDRTKQTASLR